MAPARVRFHQLPSLKKLRHHLHSASYNFSRVPLPTPKILFIRSPVKCRQGKPLRPAQRSASPTLHPPAHSSSPRTGTRGDQICLLRPEESSCQHNTPVNHAGKGGRFPREALIGESPNKAVRSHPRTYLLDQHFQNHQRESKERSREGTESEGWRQIAPARLVLDAWAVPGGAGKGASSLAATGCRGSSLPRSSNAKNNRGVGGRSCRQRGSGAASPAAPSACPDSHLPRRDAGPEPRRRGRIRGAAAAAARRCERRRREAASGSPGCNGRAGAARTGAPRWCRCPGRGGDAAAGDSGRLFGSVRKVTAATRPTLNPPPRRTRGRGKEEEGGRRRGWGLAAVHFPAQNQVTAASPGLSLRDAGLGAPEQPRLPQAPGRGRAPLPLDSRIYARYHGASFRAQKLSRFLRR